MPLIRWIVVGHHHKFDPLLYFHFTILLRYHPQWKIIWKLNNPALFGYVMKSQIPRYGNNGEH